MKLIIACLLLALVSSQVIVTNFGCKIIAADGSCTECSNRFYKDGSGICQPVSDSCLDYNPTNGACTSCFGGFILLEVICIPDPNPRDPNCAEFTGDICSKCSTRFYLLDGACTPIDPNCKTFDYATSLCSECYSGFTLANNICAIAPAGTVLPGCA
jgi:hypothetical protein